MKLIHFKILLANSHSTKYNHDKKFLSPKSKYDITQCTQCQFLKWMFSCFDLSFCS
jgi:hypothetical protein